jgi:GntR family transcriptional regulator, arabinose operon transcriptional repressor
MSTIQIDQNSPISIYMQLLKQLRIKIQTGEWLPGTRLPSELELAKEHNISRGTVRQAMMLLVSEGLVERSPGKGTFVSTKTFPAANHLIGAILPYKYDSLTLDILFGIEEIAREHDYHVIFSQTQADPIMEAVDVQSLRAKGVSGLIIFPPSNIKQDETIAQLHQEGFPFVLVDRYFPDLPTDYVVVDNFDGGYQATRHLIELGHRRIGFLTPSGLNTSSVYDRFRGYRQALTEHNLPYDEPLYLQYRGLMETDQDLTTLRAYLHTPERPSAIFTVTDLLAIRILEAATMEGLCVPDDLAIVGFDDINQAAQVSVPLTTVAQPREQIGKRACEILLRRMQGKEEKPSQTMLPVQLIIRQSCGA